MTGEKDLEKLLKTMKPTLNVGDYVFCTVKDITVVDVSAVIMFFKEAEGYTIILEKQIADRLQLDYTFVAAWITLTVHSALDAVGLTAAFSKALTAANISSNVVAGYYHDHIFVATKDAEMAMRVLNGFGES